jgi:hypothetical protein
MAASAPGAPVAAVAATPVPPAGLVVLIPTVKIAGQAAANVLDCAPIVNIPFFPACKSTMNPGVVAATAAAMGVPMTGPCTYAPMVPMWSPGSPTVMVRGQPGVNNTCMATCMWGGSISFNTIPPMPLTAQTSVVNAK